MCDSKTITEHITCNPASTGSYGRKFEDAEVLSTPGEILEEEFLEPLGISHYRLAKTIGVSQSAISDIVHGRRAITARMSLLLGMALGTGPHFWLNLQNTYDLKIAEANGLPDITPLVAREA
ncbi:HigA family addiction module antitoxin [Bifidobacterium callitrichos]|uniref:HigA family addiction module antidote protein n=1 Tax=Bifidobacterium callitrichos DSM 23973 TaxID=1437609 RepID=A0A087A5Y9_9BIFI|nr:HigA family addiction module antitoxin [Bifidobacterium callitrichos]KFI54189.1 HigA family addiction module antidote protein [Bifidobacterium callitrichos DSM 23973]